MYGPYIRHETIVQYIYTLPNSEKVYIIIDGEHVKMVSQSGEAKYYTGTINDFNADKWTDYIDVKDNYKIKFFTL